MKIIIFFLIKIPRKITRIIFYQLEYLYYRFLYSKPKLEIDCTQKRYLICGGIEQGYIGNTFRELFPDKGQPKIAKASLICEHIFDLLGSNPKKLSPEGEGYQQIDWHSDFKSGYRWDPKVFFRHIRYGHVEGVDIKVPWELSRFQHLNILGQTYLITKDKKYLDEFVNQITDWIDNNPVGFGVNWYYAMDVAIRVANWLVASEYFFKEDTLPKDFLYKFYLSVYEHGKFIRSHLERSKIATNHYLSDIVGLFFIAIYCPFLKESKKWLGFCIKELANAMGKQVYEDGCDFEASTSYHRLALEMFFYCSLLAERGGVSLPKAYEDKLKKMFEVSLYCIKPNGFIPQIGDNDSGRFLIFAKRPILEHKYLLTLASIYYKDSSFKLPNFNFDEEAFWVFGNKGKKSYDELPSRIDPLTSKSFPDAGWFIIRHHNDYCFISCGSNGQNGIGGHAHNDKLSFELMIGGKDIIVDPGTYVYSSYPDERNKFRSTGYHNTISFNGFEQNKISDKNIFKLIEDVRIVNFDLAETVDEIIFKGEVQYSGITHRRKICLKKNDNQYILEDFMSSRRALTGRLAFYLFPYLSINKNYILNAAKEKIAYIKPESVALKKEEYNYSPAYGEKIEAKCLFALFKLNVEKKTIITRISKV